MTSDVRMIEHNKRITSNKYYTIDEATKCKIYSKTVFIIANERSTNNRIGRYYTVFPSFKTFLNNRDSYPNCHEIIVDHINNKPNNAGRLVFDFDIKNIGIVPDDFKNQIQNTILNVIENNFTNVNTDIIDFVWSTSKNVNKFSKHLTVKNMYFENWINLSKIFYKLFCTEWDKNYEWIKSIDLVDSQIIRKNGSLRMVGSSKIGGNPLTLDNSDHNLQDSLIRIYLKSKKISEQLITLTNINKNIIDNIIFEKNNTDNDISLDEFEPISKNKISIENKLCKLDKLPDKIYELSYKIFCKYDGSNFKIGRILGSIISLIRLNPSNCLISGKYHENENSFIVINNDINGSKYVVKYGCYRYCGKYKTITIGSIQKQSNKIELNKYIYKKYIKNEKDRKKMLQRSQDFMIENKCISFSLYK